MPDALGPALDDDARPAFLFQRGEEDWWAVALDEMGTLLPAPDGPGKWILRDTFALGIHEPVPFPIDPEPIIRGIDARGYYVWRQTNTNKTHGTSQ